MNLYFFLILGTFISTILSSDFICTAGKNPQNLSKKEYLLEFAKGPCSPALFSPALSGTKLVVEITNCQNFKNNYKEIFNNCGFTDCHKEIYEFWKKVPESEYIIWVPKLFSPVSIYTFSKASSMCFAQLIKKRVDFSKPIKTSLIETDAFIIRVFGNTPQTKDLMECGDNVSANLFPYKYQPKPALCLYPLIQEMRKMGFVTGLTMQVVPYDWTKSYRNNEFNSRFKDNLERLHNLTNKKVVLIGHSYGNNNIYYQLTKLSTDIKNKLIKNWISLGFGTLGSIEVQSTMVAGTDYFVYLNQEFGLKIEASIEFANGHLALFENLAIDPYHQFEGQDWFKAFEKRVQYESFSTISFEDSGFNFLPGKTEKCNPVKFNIKQDCLLGIKNTKDQTIIKILEKSYSAFETEKLFEEWHSTEDLLKFYKHAVDEKYYQFENPGVPMIAIILRNEPTPNGVYYHEDVRENVKKGRFSNYTKTLTSGDGTMTSNSLYTAFLKWAFEYDNKNPLIEAKPIKFIDFCSIYKPRTSPYDVISESQEKVITKNEFFGIACDCMNKPTPNECNHAMMISDSNVINIIIETLLANENGYTKKFEDFVEGLSDQYLIDITEKCVQLDIPKLERSIKAEIF